ncbi:MAG TPA: DUF6457 domain-containing protein [Solirubrobacteraceae bacterium]|nr:DUF6457 domain-containing protein [Solirubrobacteraceae bacterium]
MDAPEWIAAFAAEAGVAPPTEEEVGQLLALAGIAAHASERTAAPISCWIAARAGLSPAAAQDLASRLAGAAGEQ